MGYAVRNRNFGPPPSPMAMTPGVKWLLILNTGIWLLYFLFYDSVLGRLITSLGLSPRDVLQHFTIWQLCTYMFVQSAGGFGHILINMLTLWMFGSPLEQTWGTQRFLRYYLFCGIGAGLCVVVLNLLFGSLDTRTIGASGAVYGLLLAFGMLFPDTTIYFSFLFPIKAKYYVWIMGAIVFLSTLRDSGGQVSHFAHLGGMLAGFIYLKTRMGIGPRTNYWAKVEDGYREWKRQRAKKKFQVYMKRHGGKDDRWVN
jgi:membrane associated rhomboid family serine protease